MEHSQHGHTQEETDIALQDKVDTIVLPGDLVGRITDLKIRLGSGLIQHQDYIVATKAGYLRNPTTKYYWVENLQKRYVPALEDMVIGIVIDKHAESFKVDIGSAQAATLPVTAFEGATKKNRPNLQVGSLVYCRVVLANKDMEPELSCMSVRNKAEGYGELVDGYMVRTSLTLAYRLLDENCAVLQQLGRVMPYEIAVGMNGRVWVKASSYSAALVVLQAILLLCDPHHKTPSRSVIDSTIQSLLKHFSLAQ